MQKNEVSKVENDQHVLVQLGLTSQQAKVYLALSKFQQASVKEISKSAGIDKSEVYRAILGLQKLGLVDKIILKPINYSVISLDAGIHFLVERKKSETLSIEKRAQELIKLRKGKESFIQPNPEQNITYAYRSEIYNSKVTELYRRTEFSLDVITTLEREKERNPNDKELRKLKTKGIKSRVIIEIPNFNEENRQRIQSLQSHYDNFNFRLTTQKIAMPLGIFDKKELLIYLSETTNYREASLLHTNNPRMVNLLTQYFDNLWEKAKPISLVWRD